MGKIAFVFSGQGAQAPGMGKELYDCSAAAKAVLDRTLPHGYIIAQQDNNSQAMQWLTRLRDNSHRFG